MKNEETIEVLNEILDVLGYSHYSNSREYIAVNTAIQALKKQIPKKPIIKVFYFIKDYYCPTCEKYVDKYDKDMTVCSHCGQKIDWSEME